MASKPPRPTVDWTNARLRSTNSSPACSRRTSPTESLHAESHARASDTICVIYEPGYDRDGLRWREGISPTNLVG
eukprot:1185813-Prorocentrum_minimum.AAC.1